VAAKLPDFEKEVGYLEDRTQSLDQRLPTTPALRQLRVQLDERAEPDGVKLERLEAAHPIDAGRLYQTIGLEIEARGNLAALGRFVAGLWRTPRLVSVSGAHMRRAPQRGFLLTLEAETYAFKPEADGTSSSR
jgi:Tfp pilus assembly protein PilO